MNASLLVWDVLAGLLLLGLVLYGRAEWVAGKRAARRMDFEARRAIRRAEDEWLLRQIRSKVRTDLLLAVLNARSDFLLETRDPPLRLLAALNEPVDEFSVRVPA